MSLLARLEKQKLARVKPEKQAENRPMAPKDPYEQLKSSIHKRIIEEMKEKPADKECPESLAVKIENMVVEILENESAQIPRMDKLRIAREISDDAIAFGPITPLLNETEITEVMVNG
ncbi:MAG: CpaF family protein, partial [Desulfotomaculaceae bacterium]|nr:CpaF family protein [Desulfotomaculaceae bacterium]